MAADLETFAWNSNMSKRFMTLNKVEEKEEQQEWEELDEPID